MSRVSLLNWRDPTFAFEHMMSHRNAFGVISPLTRFSILPYWLDPLTGVSVRGGDWHQRHQQAHNDAALSLPSHPGSHTPGVAIWSNLKEWNLSDPIQAEAWAFDNHMEHMVAATTVLPPGTPSAPVTTFPFW